MDDLKNGILRSSLWEYQIVEVASGYSYRVGMHGTVTNQKLVPAICPSTWPDLKDMIKFIQDNIRLDNQETVCFPIDLTGLIS